MTDVKGDLILTREEWNALSDTSREIKKDSITTEVTDQNGKSFPVDYNLAIPLQQMINAGYHTGQSCSGTTSDHPGHRYVADSKLGLFKKGDIIPAGNGTYLTFWKPEAQWKGGVNDAKQIENILSTVNKNGWIVEEMDIFFQPSILIRLPYTNDGSGKGELLNEGNIIMDKKYPGLQQKDFLKWLDVREEILHLEVYQKHGGIKQWTDNEIIQKWEELANALVLAATNDKEKDLVAERISDVHFIRISDSEYAISCKIDGQQQTAEKLSKQDMNALNSKIDRKELAAKYFETTLNNSGEINNGIKR